MLVFFKLICLRSMKLKRWWKGKKRSNNFCDMVWKLFEWLNTHAQFIKLDQRSKLIWWILCTMHRHKYTAQILRAREHNKRNFSFFFLSCHVFRLLLLSSFLSFYIVCFIRNQRNYYCYAATHQPSNLLTHSLFEVFVLLFAIWYAWDDYFGCCSDLAEWMWHDNVKSRFAIFIFIDSKNFTWYIKS